MPNENGKHQKVATIIWTIDPDGELRFLLRHNKPFNGYTDEWTIAFGSVEQEDKNLAAAAVREACEEYGSSISGVAQDLDYSIEYEGRHGLSVIHFFSLRLENIDLPITLNEESIGYDWIGLAKAKELMLHADEFKALELVSESISPSFSKAA